MEMQDIIRQAEENIRQAIRDYGRHTYQMDVLEDISDEFIVRLAEDSSEAKQELRELFSKSPVWHPELDALIINGTRTHDPDHQRVRELAQRILHGPIEQAVRVEDYERYGQMLDAIEFFAVPDSVDVQARGVQALNTLAPRAYRPGKKLSRVFKALCVELGVADETAGSEFQHLYAQFADELSSQKISFKLFVSINPAHFLTMSNPKKDTRGQCLTSCHSLNSTEYEYNNGCTGYARDEVSFLVFTVDDPTDEETLNNRKTTRQLFAYKPGNGVLLQSRMYNTAGGVYGAAEESKLYRDLVQREISMLEGQPNLWRTIPSTSPVGCGLVYRGEGFGGYPDWEYENFDGKVSIRHDCEDEHEPLEIGTWGLCAKCADETSHGAYCEDCDPDRYAGCCDDCDTDIEDEDDLYTVYDSSGNSRQVCYRCRGRGYTLCDHCGEYHADSVMERVNGLDVCPNCLEEYYQCCEDCGDYCKIDDMAYVTDRDGDEICVCPDCRRDHYESCDHCGEWFHEDLMCDAHNVYGDDIRVCEDCCEKHYETCEQCGERFHEDLMCDAHNDCGEPIRVCEDCYEELVEEAEADEDELSEGAEPEMKEAV